MLPTSMQPPPKSRKKAPTLRDDDWEPHKTLITRLYTSGTTLSDVMDIVKTETGFHAEVRQYKSRISKWKIDRNIKPKEMKFIVKKRQKRKLVEVAKPQLNFRVRGNEVDSAKIDRWMREHDVPQSRLCSPSSMASTPSAIDCRTNTESGTPVMRSPTPTPIYDLDWEFYEVDGESRWYHSLYFGNTNNQYLLRDQIWQIWHKFSWRARYTTMQYSAELVELDRAKQETDVFVQHSLDNGYAMTALLRQLNLLFLPTLLEYKDSRILSQVLDYWLSIGCDLEYRNINEETPLLKACHYHVQGTYMYLSILIERGADVSARDCNGRGALDLTLMSSAKFLPIAMICPPHYSVQLLELKLQILLQSGCPPQLQDIWPETSAGWQTYRKAIEREKKRRSLLLLEDMQHLPTLE